MGNELSNKKMVDQLVNHDDMYITSPRVEGAFRAVNRAMYLLLEDGDDVDPYENQPWRKGNLHLSAPCIYAKVVEALELKPGQSFLNLGSGTGYLNTIIGLLIGPNGVNHGVEIHADVVEYAYERLRQFNQKSYAIDKFDFVQPTFVQGNCLNLNPNTRYDRIYLGAACLPEMESFIRKLIKPNGGILVMPFDGQLMKHVRIGEQKWRTEKLMDVTFTLMIGRHNDIHSDTPSAPINMPLPTVKSLKELSRIAIRQHLREKTEKINPDLPNSDNYAVRELRKKIRAQIIKRLGEEHEQMFKLREKCRANQRKTIRNASNSDPATSSASHSATPGSLGSSEAQVGISSGRVLTRSACRRLESDKVSTDRTDSNHRATRSSRVAMMDARGDPEDLSDTSSNLEGSDRDDDNDNSDQDDSNNHRDRQNCARSRPFVHSIRRPRANFSRILGQPSQSRTSRPSFLVELSSSSSSDEEDFANRVDEYGQVRRHLLMNWPSSWSSNALRVNALANGPSTSELSNMSDNSDYLLNEPDDDHDDDEDDWESAQSSGSEFTVQDDSTERSVGGHSSARTRAYGQREDLTNDPTQSPISNSSNQQPAEASSSIMSFEMSRPRTSGGSGEPLVTGSSFCEQEPVARRLRPRTHTASQDQISSDTTGSILHKVPSNTCQRGTNLLTGDPRNCSVHRRRQHTCSHVHHHRHATCRHRNPRQIHHSCSNALCRHRCTRTARCAQRHLESNKILPSRIGRGPLVQEISSSSRSDQAGSSAGRDVPGASTATNSSGSVPSIADLEAELPPASCSVCNRPRTSLKRCSFKPHQQVKRRSSQRQSQQEPPEPHLENKRKRHSSSESLDSGSQASPDRLSCHHLSSRVRHQCTCRSMLATSSSRSRPAQQNLVSGSSSGRVGANEHLGQSRERNVSLPDASMSLVTERQSPGWMRSVRLEPIGASTRARVEPGGDSAQRRASQPHQANAPVANRIGNSHFMSLSSRIDRFESIFRDSIRSSGSPRSMHSLLGVNCRPPRAQRPEESFMDQQLRFYRPYPPNARRDVEMARRQVDMARRQAQLISSRLDRRKREERQSHECRQYHSLISEYISLLPLPKVLHEYLNFERNL